MTTTPKTFVLMPFDPEFQPIYEDLIKPALEDAGYDVARADSIVDQQNILRDIVQGIATADLIVADLTTLNANVFYELGLCHGLRIPTVLIAQSIDEVPFDLRSYKVEIYETRFDKIHKLKEALKNIGERHKKREVIFGSPIIDFLPSERKAAAVNSREVMSDESVEEQLEESEEKGLLDYSAEIEEAFAEMNRVLEVTTKENESIANKVAGHGARLQALNASTGAGTAGQKQKVALLIASDMNLCAKRFEEELPNFEKAIITLDEGISGLMSFVKHTPEDREQLVNFRQILTFFSENSKNTTDTFRNLRDVVAELKGISKDVNRASRNLVHSFDGMVQNLEKVEAFAIRAMALMDQWLEEDDSANAQSEVAIQQQL